MLAGGGFTRCHTPVWRGEDCKGDRWFVSRSWSLRSSRPSAELACSVSCPNWLYSFCSFSGEVDLLVVFVMPTKRLFYTLSQILFLQFLSFSFMLRWSVCYSFSCLFCHFSVQIALVMFDVL